MVEPVSGLLDKGLHRVSIHGRPRWQILLSAATEHGRGMALRRVQHLRDRMGSNLSQKFGFVHGDLCCFLGILSVFWLNNRRTQAVLGTIIRLL